MTKKTKNVELPIKPKAVLAVLWIGIVLWIVATILIKLKVGILGFHL